MTDKIKLSLLLHIWLWRFDLLLDSFRYFGNPLCFLLVLLQMIGINFHFQINCIFMSQSKNLKLFNLFQHFYPLQLLLPIVNNQNGLISRLMTPVFPQLEHTKFTFLSYTKFTHHCSSSAYCPPSSCQKYSGADRFKDGVCHNKHISHPNIFPIQIVGYCFAGLLFLALTISSSQFPSFQGNQTFLLYHFSQQSILKTFELYDGSL